MNCKEYIQTMVSSNELIYIDTAALMDTEGMELFVKNCSEVLRSYNRKIIVPKAVCLELARHLGSGNSRKSECAMKVLGILAQNSDIFEVCNSAMSEEEISKAFADSQLLAELTLHKAEHGQLLITNDKKLSKDAYGLNSQESCRGHRIMVCYINREGALYMCDCVKESKTMTETTADLSSSEKQGSPQPVEESDCTLNKNQSDVNATQNSDRVEKKSQYSTGLATAGIATGTFVAGILLEKNKTAIVRLITSLF